MRQPRVHTLLMPVLLLWIAAPPAHPAAPAAFHAQATGPNTIVLLNADEALVPADDAASLCLPLSTDPYSERAWQFEVSEEALGPGGWTLEVLHADRGAGVIRPALSIGGVSLPLGRMESYTRLNTQTERTAAFAFELPADRAGLRRIDLRGVQYLRGLRISPAWSDAHWEALRAAVPTRVTPMVTLSRPLDLVTTAGISVMNDPDVEAELNSLHNLAPLAKVLGFTAIEMYVRWNMLEPEREGRFDFSYYDQLVAKLDEYGLKWFPLLIVGSAYALPEWFAASPENAGFRCLEHGISNEIQSIWSPHHGRHVERVLQAFGTHYGTSASLAGVRLGPSGNYGESQYPAGGNWPLKGRTMHIHIGLWSADAHAVADYRGDLAAKYGEITALNTAWSQEHESFETLPMPLPEQIVSKRQRIDFLDWYTRSMTEWCAYWAETARAAMPEVRMYQSSGGWGFVEAGTSYSGQAKSMAEVVGGIRLTNETDSYEQNFYATRLAVTAARHYGIPRGYEPASSHTGRGVAARIFNTAATNGDHLFTYHSNLFNHEYAISQWLRYLPMLDVRAEPVVDVAVFYPETMNQLDDATFRHLYAWGFNPRAAAVRRAVEVDYLDELLIRDGFLDRYKVLVFAWGEFIEADVIEKIDGWLRRGGCILYPSFPRGPLTTIEGESAVFSRWASGDTGAGQFHRFRGDMEPPEDYGAFVRERLQGLGSLAVPTRRALETEHPGKVFISARADGSLLILNYNSHPVEVSAPECDALTVPAYGIAIAEARDASGGGPAQ